MRGQIIATYSVITRLRGFFLITLDEGGKYDVEYCIEHCIEHCIAQCISPLPRMRWQRALQRWQPTHVPTQVHGWAANPKPPTLALRESPRAQPGQPPGPALTSPGLMQAHSLRRMRGNSLVRCKVGGDG